MNGSATSASRVEEHRQTEQALHRPAQRQPAAAELPDESDQRRARQKRVIRLLVEPALGEDGFVEEPSPDDTSPKSDVAPAKTQNAGVRSVPDRVRPDGQWLRCGSQAPLLPALA